MNQTHATFHRGNADFRRAFLLTEMRHKNKSFLKNF